MNVWGSEGMVSELLVPDILAIFSWQKMPMAVPNTKRDEITLAYFVGKDVMLVTPRQRHDFVHRAEILFFPRQSHHLLIGDIMTVSLQIHSW